MTLIEEIQNQVRQLPPEKQGQVLDFINFLQPRAASQPPDKKRPLKQHPAFGSWRGRGVNALKYQGDLRAEWDSRL
ncbi:MAG: DUF2281 domain-containing protein [Chloroflexota bacterium]